MTYLPLKRLIHIYMLYIILLSFSRNKILCILNKLTIKIDKFIHKLEQIIKD